jgi:hypothetical protein
VTEGVTLKTRGGSQAALLPSDTVQAIAALMLTTLMLASLLSMGATVRRNLNQTAETALAQAEEVVRGLEGTAVRIGELATAGPQPAAVGPAAPQSSIVLVPLGSPALTTSGDDSLVTVEEPEVADLGPGRSRARGLRKGIHGPPEWARAFSVSNLDVRVRSGPPAARGKGADNDRKARSKKGAPSK